MMKEIKLKNGCVLTIRQASEDDGSKLLDYMNQVGGESNFLTFGKNECRNNEEQEKRFIQEMREQPGSIFLVGYVGDELACSADLRGGQKKRTAHNCDFGVTVRKKYWHMGMASALLSELIYFAKSSPVLRTIHLGVYENNSRAVRLYERLGFRQVGRYKNYFRVGDSYFDEILMDLDVSSTQL